MKYKVTLYQEIYTHLEIEAKSEDEARDLVLRGEFDEFDDATTIDIEVKESEIIDLEAVFYNNTASLFIEHTILAFMKYAKNKQNLPFIRDAPELEPDIAYALSKKCVTFPLKVHTLGIWNKPSYVEEISATDSNGNAALLKTLMFPYVVETAYYAVYRNKHYIWFDSPRRHVCGVSSGNTFGIAAIVSAWVCSRMAVETDLAKIAARTA